MITNKGSDLAKGVSLWKENNHKSNIPTIDDLSHVVANALKKQFEDTEPFRKFKEIINTGAARMRQTSRPQSVISFPRSCGAWGGFRVGCRVTSNGC